MMSVENVVVGAGPYGLSIAAHFRQNNVEALVVGQPMEGWRNHMPAGMILKSETFASNLSDPQRQYTLERFYRERGVPYRRVGNPLAMSEFIAYADWFRQQAVPEVRNLRLESLRELENGFELVFDDGSRVRTKRVVLATGHVSFQHTPALLESFASELVTHTSQHRDLSRFRGQDITVIGRGQSALETAALVHEQGANVRILVRADRVEWNSDSSVARSLVTRLRRPEAGLGPGWYSLAISELPKMYFRLPLRTRDQIFKTKWGPSGAWWLRERVVGKIPTLTSQALSHVTERNGKLELSVETGGKTKTFQTDHVIAATGYKVDLKRLAFLEDRLRARIRVFDGSPRLSTTFESSVPGLHFVGLTSAQSFGPVMRFVYGAQHAAAILTQHIRGAKRAAVPNAEATTSAGDVRPLARS
jgi:thioredoxin reductase